MSDKFKTTPGPWKKSPLKPDTVISESAQGVDLEHVKYYGGFCIAESILNESDRKLIAAAPEMLNLLIKILDGFHGVRGYVRSL